MSYDFSLYDAAFLRRVIADGLGDWTGPPDLEPAVVSGILQLANANGFVATPHDQRFVEFLKSQGVTPSTDYQLETPRVSVMLQIFNGSIGLSVPTSDRAIASVEFARNFGLQLAQKFGLGFQDPQTGEITAGPA
ncbi:hypothetical protein [Frateuria defendens]|uniref:hypothetical protein n=1 Tax=Frateuria defendens TaxID=2219559 RepID=UPI001292DC0E|nr:hypothetical protein [Frateuria defendens]